MAVPLGCWMVVKVAVEGARPYYLKLPDQLMPSYAVQQWVRERDCE